jgi:hypothetical protein
MTATACSARQPQSLLPRRRAAFRPAAAERPPGFFERAWNRVRTWLAAATCRFTASSARQRQGYPEVPTR